MGSSPEAPILELQGVGKRFSDQTLALDGIDLDVRPGELVSVVGPSGCGKSTLLRIVAGLAGPTSGVVAMRTRRIGFAFPEPTLLPWRGAQANPELLGELEGTPARQRQHLAGEAIAVVGLGELAGHRPQALWGGTGMQASLGRSLTLRPDLFLLDEPFRSLDELTRHRLNDELVQLFLERGFAALLATRSVNEAVFLSSRVVVLSARPSRALETFRVPFPYPRPPGMRFSSGFTRLAGEVSECLLAGRTPQPPKAGDRAPLQPIELAVERG